MFNLKRMNGTFKGNIGECMFKLTRRYLFLTRFHSKYTVMPIIRKYISEDQAQFLWKYWFSIDGIEIIGRKPVLYEIKTKNRYELPVDKKTKTTGATVAVLSAAKELGFEVQLAVIWLEKDWEYSVEIEGFDQEKLYIDTQKPYDRGYFKIPSLSEDPSSM